MDSLVKRYSGFKLKKIVISFAAVFTVIIGTISNIDGTISFINRLFNGNGNKIVTNMTTHTDLHLWGQLVSMVITFILSYYLLITFFKIREEMKDAVDNSNAIIKSNKEEVDKFINDNKEKFNGFIENVYNYNHINYNSITTRLFRDSLLWYVVNKDKDFLNHFAELMYRSHITVPQLEDYGMGKDFIDAYKLHIHNVEYNNVANCNPIVANIYEGNHNEQKEHDINLENKQIVNEPNRDK